MQTLSIPTVRDTEGSDDDSDENGTSQQGRDHAAPSIVNEPERRSPASTRSVKSQSVRSHRLSSIGGATLANTPRAHKHVLDSDVGIDDEGGRGDEDEDVGDGDDEDNTDQPKRRSTAGKVIEDARSALEVLAKKYDPANYYNHSKRVKNCTNKNCGRSIMGLQMQWR